jgi:serine/threonine-protein kinase
MIHAEIASGGMASVHLARLLGPSGFARTVAVKIPHPELARHREYALMLMDEARLTARVRHPNVVPMLDVIQTPDELALVMDYVHGASLCTLMRAARRRGEAVPVGIAAAILVDTLHGLHAAHEATDEGGRPLGIVHRDVSPQNILVGADGTTRLGDFGIAKAARRLQGQSGADLKGKFAYMAPEQVTGEPVSRLTDVFAAAIVLWEALAGRPLFEGTTDAVTLHNCVWAPIRRPSAFVPGLPPALDAVVMKGLSRDPAARYPTARAMALDLQACVEAVRPSRVAAWVERVAGDALIERAELLAQTERGSPRHETPTLRIVHPVDEEPTIATPRRAGRWASG